jgi:AmiR/NasT family two-component response regulator
VAQTELDGLQEAMKTRAYIEQAKGILMAARGLSADDAFATLNEQSQNTNVKVVTIAQRLIGSVAAQQTLTSGRQKIRVVIDILLQYDQS